MVFQHMSDAVYTNIRVVQKLTSVDVVVDITRTLFMNKHTILILDPNTHIP